MVPLVFQLLVPLVLVAWLAAKPPASLLGKVCVAMAGGAWLLAGALAGMWTLLPWWTPRASGVALLVLVAWRVQAHRQPLLPEGRRERVAAGGCMLVAVLALLLAAFAAAGRKAPSGVIADIGSPFMEGTFLVVNGGSNPIVNAHLKTASDEPRFRHWRGQSHGVDLIRIDGRGLRAIGWRPADPSDYLGFGAAVVAPCDGIVVQAANDVHDNEVPRTNRERMAGNHVVLRCLDFELLLAHLRRGSVAVRRGDPVIRGQLLGELGNSGNSDEPHLHLHAQQIATADDPFASDPLPLRIDGRYLVRNDRLDGASRRATR